MSHIAAAGASRIGNFKIAEQAVEAHPPCPSLSASPRHSAAQDLHRSAAVPMALVWFTGLPVMLWRDSRV